MAQAPALPNPGPQTPDERRAISERFIIHAREELAEGNRLQAGEKAWGAVAQYLKIIGERRGWNHHRHRDLEDIGRQMLAEHPEYDTGPVNRSLNDAYHRGHENFYENRESDALVEETINNVERDALPVLESLTMLPPRGFEISSNAQLERLISLTGDKTLKKGDKSSAGFSLRHKPPNGNGGHGDPPLPSGPGPSPTDSPQVGGGGLELSLPTVSPTMEDPLPLPSVTAPEPQPSLTRQSGRTDALPRQRGGPATRPRSIKPAAPAPVQSGSKSRGRKNLHPMAKLRRTVQRAQRRGR